MEISLDNAQRIVSEISSVLGADVNLMDQSAAIIASTDASRVGNHHSGAEKIISERLDQLIVSPEDHIPGVRAGLNLPIWVDSNIAGVLGITGDPASFTTPAHVLQKMTEILLRETRVREDAERHERSSTRFLQAWLTDTPELTPELIEQGKSFSIDVLGDYIIAAANVVSAGQPPHLPSATFQEEIDRIGKQFSDDATEIGATTGMLGSRIIALFPVPDTLSPNSDREILHPDQHLGDVTSWLASAARRVRKSSTMKLAVGVSGSGRAPAEAAEQAIKALRHAIHSPIDVHRFDSLSLELLLAAIPEHERRTFAERVFRDVPPNSRTETKRYLQAYFDADGSLSRAADALFVHKNTLNGRLNRIAEVTAFDPRRIADAAVLWLALRIEE